MSEITPEDAYRMHYTQVTGGDGEPEVAFGELSDMATQMYAIESDLLKDRLVEDEQFAVAFVNECLAGSYSEKGIAKWWVRARALLDGKTPQEVWAYDRMKVVELAKSITGPMGQT